MATFSAFAQNVNRNVGDFHKVTTFDRIDAQLVASSENRVVIDGKDADQVQIVNKNGELKVRMPIGKLLQGDHISVTIYFTGLKAAEANEGSRIASEATLSGGSFDLQAREGAEVHLNFDVDKLNVKGSGGARIELSGKATYQDVLLNSGAEYEARTLETAQTTITVNAGGNAEVHASDLVEAKVRAGGNITIFGNPKQVNEKTVAGGNIKRM